MLETPVKAPTFLTLCVLPCAGVNYKEGAWFVQATLARDQDITLGFAALRDILNRIARLRGPAAGGRSHVEGAEAILTRARAMHPEYYIVDS
jgi:hypothetical protein